MIFVISINYNFKITKDIFRHWNCTLEFMFIKLITELKKLPFIRIIFPFIAGIFFETERFSNHVFYIIPIVLLSLFFGVFYFLHRIKKHHKLRFTAGIAVYSAFFLLGGYFTNLYSEKESILTDKEITAKAIIISLPEEKENTYKFIAEINIAYTDSLFFKQKEKILIYALKDCASAALEYGDEIIFSGTLQSITNSGNPKEFDYKSFLYKKGIRNRFYLQAGKYKVSNKNKGNMIVAFAEKTRAQLSSIYRKNGIEGDEFAVLAALTLGDKSELDNEIKNAYSASGAMHILAVSGLHVGIIYVIINYLLSFLDKLKYRNFAVGKYSKAIILILFLWFFAFLTGLSPSVRRAAIMFSFLIVGKALDRPLSIYNSLASSAFVLLLINPFLVFEVGFQMSYLAVLSIVIFQPHIDSFFNPKNKIIQAIWSLTAVSIAAQIGTAPISLYYFHIFPNYFMLTNIIVIPLATGIVYGAAILFAVSFISPVAAVAAFLLKKIVFLLNFTVKTVESFPFSYTQNITFNIIDLVLFVIIIISLYFFMVQKNSRALHFVFVSFIAFLISGFVLKYYNYSTKQVYIYNVNKESAYRFTYKNTNILYTYDSCEISSNVKYAVQNHLVATAGTKFNLRNIENGASQSGQFLKFGDKKFLIINSKDQVKFKGNKKIKLDYIILSKNIYVYINDILELYEPGQIIFDSSNKLMRIERWREECEEAGIQYFSVPEQGAFLLKWN